MKKLFVLMLMVSLPALSQSTPVDGRWSLRSAMCSDGTQSSVDLYNQRFTVVFSNGFYDGELQGNNCHESVQGNFYLSAIQIQLIGNQSSGNCGSSVNWFDGTFYLGAPWSNLRLESVFPTPVCPPNSSLILEFFGI